MVAKFFVQICIHSSPWEILLWLLWCLFNSYIYTSYNGYWDFCSNLYPQKSLRNPFVSGAMAEMTGMNANDLIRNLESLSSMDAESIRKSKYFAEILFNMTECIELDRFMGVDSETEMRLKARELYSKKELLAGEIYMCFHFSSSSSYTEMLANIYRCTCVYICIYMYICELLSPDIHKPCQGKIVIAIRIQYYFAYTGVVFMNVDEDNNRKKRALTASGPLPKHIKYKIRMDIDNVHPTNMLKQV